MYKRQHPAIVFGWRCPRGLTASHDFRAAPTVPGIEYGYSIVVTWHSSEPSATAEADLLNLRDDWYRPVKVEPITGTVLCYDKTRECPARAIAFDGCFNRAEGTYRATAADGTFAAKLDPEGIRRRTLAWRVAGLTSPTRTCRLGTALLRPGQDFLEQALPENETLIVVTKPIDTPIRLEIQ